MDEQIINEHVAAVILITRGLQAGKMATDDNVALEAAARVYSAVLFRDTVEKLIESVNQS